MAFGFLPGGGFAVGHHQGFDRNIPHSFIRVQAPVTPRTVSKGKGIYAVQPRPVTAIPKISVADKGKSQKRAKVPRKEGVSVQAECTVLTHTPATTAEKKKRKIRPAKKAAKPTRRVRPAKAKVPALTAEERREGWKRPSKKHVIGRRTVQPLLEAYLGDNRFAVLARLTCSQRKELDRTGTQRVPRRTGSAGQSRRGDDRRQ